jgi:hypothetical protein
VSLCTPNYFIYQPTFNKFVLLDLQIGWKAACQTATTVPAIVSKQQHCVRRHRECVLLKDILVPYIGLPRIPPDGFSRSDLPATFTSTNKALTQVLPCEYDESMSFESLCLLYRLDAIKGTNNNNNGVVVCVRVW